MELGWVRGTHVQGGSWDGGRDTGSREGAGMGGKDMGSRVSCSSLLKRAWFLVGPNDAHSPLPR